MVAEMVLWPAERRLQGMVATARGDAPGGVGDDVVREGAGGPVGAAGLCLQAGVVGLALGVALVFVGVLMVAQP